MTTDVRDAQRAAYVCLLMDLARYADVSRLPSLCDRIERAIASGATYTPAKRRRTWPLLHRAQL